MSEVMAFKNTVCTTSLASASCSHGAIPLGDGTTRFSLWAPDADAVTLILGDGRQFELEYQEDGWRCVVIENAEAISYRYRINGKLEVPDPAARLLIAELAPGACR